jgi:hypothetical protein
LEDNFFDNVLSLVIAGALVALVITFWKIYIVIISFVVLVVLSMATGFFLEDFLKERKRKKRAS